MKTNDDRYRDNPYDGDDGFVDYGQDTTPEDPYYADWSTDEYAPNDSPEQREKYYEARDRYYAERDAYYAERDAYYAEQRAQERREEERRRERDYYRAEAGRENRRAARQGRFSYEDEDEPDEPKPARKRRRRYRFFRRLLVFVLFLAMALLFLGQMPCRNDAKAPRVPGKCTILIAGLDADGMRTDTILLLSLEKRGNTVRLLSLPRDTYAPAYVVPRLNSAYGAAGGGEAGMEELLRAVQGVTGFLPDAYAAIGLDAFVQAVDVLGGVDFEVPVDMHYEDPDQNLSIHLSAGYQHLDGYQAMGLVRFRSGYADADIGRTGVQRDFLRAAARQWLKPSLLGKLPELWGIYRQQVITDLRPRHLLWLARFALKTDFGATHSDLLPGYPSMAGDASVYIPDPSAAEILKNYNPYS